MTKQSEADTRSPQGAWDNYQSEQPRTCYYNEHSLRSVPFLSFNIQKVPEKTQRAVKAVEYYPLPKYTIALLLNHIGDMFENNHQHLARDSRPIGKAIFQCTT